MKPPLRQQGVALVTALIMLVLLTLLALTSFNLGKSNLQVVSNMQQRDEAMAAAREVIEETISSTRFFESPGAALNNPCGGPNRRCVDTNGDGENDVTVVLAPAPTCVKAPIIRNNDLDISNKEDFDCSLPGPPDAFGMPGVNDGNSACADSIWEVHAVATDVKTDASVSVTQGVAVRVDKNYIEDNCPIL